MIIQSEKVWIASQFMPAQIEVEDGKIVGIYAYGEKAVDVDHGVQRIIPGFIDIHTHGAYGFDTNDAEEEGLRMWLKRIPEEGVTSLLPTTVTQSEEVLTNALLNIRKVVEAGYEGAHVVGVHFEGPYLDLKFKGAQPEQHILNSNIEQFKRYQEAANGLIKLITLAPDHDENYELTKYCAQTGVAVSMGHSGATYQQAVLGVANGAKSMTHVYNGMTPFNHREPGLIGTALRLHDTFGEIIVDGNHSHYASVNILYKSKNPGYAITVTDSLRAKGCARGIYNLGGNDFEVRENGSAYLLKSGNLAGSTLRMNAALRNLIENALVPIDIAIDSLTSNPARLLKIDDVKGKIVTGYDADLVVLADDYSVVQTYCRGKGML